MNLETSEKNVLDSPLQTCSMSPKTGFYRTGCCETGPDDLGKHIVCVQVSASFLSYSKAQGNDLSTPNPGFQFPGLVPGDRWCLCALRWKQAYDDGMAPPVILEATHQSTLEIIPLEVLKKHSLDAVQS